MLLITHKYGYKGGVNDNSVISLIDELVIYQEFVSSHALEKSNSMY